VKSEHHLYIRRCLELAQRSKGYTAPNPMVGAVLVYNGRIIGESWHKQYGEAHAEVNCLESVATENKHLIKDSTMYVSLEPCAHYGKTPPCATRLVQEKVKEVIICNTDPFEQVRGKGIKILNEHGIKTTEGILDAEGKWVNRRFFTFHQKKRPYIILKWAQTQNGYFAPLHKGRLQLSNKHSQQLVHKWRTEEAAIMIGHQTAVADNPLLTARSWNGKQPLRIVLDKRLVLSHHLNIFNEDAATWVLNEKKDENKGNISFVKLVFDEILLTRLLEKLHDANILSLIVEGGAVLLQSFIDAGLWDEARIFSTETILDEGLEAPSLKDANTALTTELDTDRLHVYTNKNAYPYVQGMEL
jgi:diaminohydroxyphosphoribosylaminopyrimidine deaminase/5-amino-6-(5-phosphoribosylamino)uracil reductase